MNVAAPRAQRRSWTLIASGLLVVGVTTMRLWQPDRLAPFVLVPTWVWLVPAGVLWWFGTRRGARWSAWFVAIVWLAFAGVFVEEPRALVRGWTAAAPSRDDDPRTVRVVSLNVGDGGPRSVRKLAPLAADVILLQEAPGANDLATLASELFGATGEFTTAGDVAIVARGHIVTRATEPGSHFVRAEVTLPGQPGLDFVCLRLHPPVSRIDFWRPGFWGDHRRVRESHRREIAEVVRTYGDSGFGPRTIVGGDLNAPPDDAALDALRGGLVDAFAVAGRGWGPTGPSAAPLFRIDQVWIGPGLRARNSTTRTVRHSDHRAVVSDLAVVDRSP